jgi:23S rRNA pseudouridine1911/1915/1917 synthase
MEEVPIIFENDDVVVVDKPSGIIVLPDGKHDYPALSSWLEEKYPSRDDNPGFYFVHRIDRETSGVLIVAKTEKAHAFLKKQFQERAVTKTYRAFVYGVIKDERGSIEKPIGSARGGGGGGGGPPPAPRRARGAATK